MSDKKEIIFKSNNNLRGVFLEHRLSVFGTKSYLKLLYAFTKFT